MLSFCFFTPTHLVCHCARGEEGWFSTNSERKKRINRPIVSDFLSLLLRNIILQAIET